MKTRFRIQAPADDLLGGGGSPGTPPAPANSPADLGTPPAGIPANPPPATPPAPAITFPDNWKDGLGDLKDDPSLGVIKDIPSLAKSFIHAQKSLGKEKIVIPDKFATKEDWTNNVWRKLGLPESADKYEFKAPEGTDPAFMGKFKEFAVGSGILPSQAEALFGFYNQHVQDSLAAEDAHHKQLFDQSVSSLKKEFGAAYDKKLGVASNLFNSIADDETKQLFKETGLGNNPKVIKLFAKMAEQLGEDKFVASQDKGNLGMTPADAQTKINEIMGNNNHPYFNSSHPSHKDAVAEVGRLFSMTVVQA